MTSAKENFEPNINFSVFKTEKSSIENLNMRNTISSSPYEYRSCFNQIDKKTNRGRKEKNPLPKDVLKCEICLQYKDISKEELIFCCICKCLFHKSCNPQYEVLPSPSNKILLYKCIRCSQAAKLHKPITDFSCFICNHSENVLNYSTQSRLFYHQPCLFFINELNSLDKEEVYREAIRKWRYKNSCKYCGEKLSKLIAVIKCSKSQCKEYYHIPCAIDKGMIFDLNFMKEFYKKSSFNQIPFFCANHNKKISRQYKDYINEKFNEIEKEKQNKKTFQNDSEFEEEKEDFENDENEMKYEDEDEKDEKFSEFCKSIASMSIADDDSENNQNEDKKEDEEESTKQKHSGTNDSMDLDDYDKNNNFNLNFEKIAKNVEKDKKKFSFKEMNSQKNNYKIGFNVDEFCSTKNNNLIMTREDSNNLLRYNL